MNPCHFIGIVQFTLLKIYFYWRKNLFHQDAIRYYKTTCISHRQNYKLISHKIQKSAFSMHDIEPIISFQGVCFKPHRTSKVMARLEQAGDLGKRLQ